MTLITQKHCPNCGAKMVYDPITGNYKCYYCGNTTNNKSDSLNKFKIRCC